MRRRRLHFVRLRPPVLERIVDVLGIFVISVSDGRIDDEKTTTLEET